MTITAALDAAVQRLHRHSASPRLDAEVLLAEILGLNRQHLLTHGEQRLTTRHQRRFIQLVERRRRGFPIPYLTGQCEFFGLTFLVTPDVLVPRPFTETLIEVFLATLDESPTGPIVDLGTGSGVIAITLAHHLQHTRIIGTDISTAALLVARQNAKRLSPTQRLRWYRGSLLRAIPISTHPQHLIANLPYVTTRQMQEPSIRREPRRALHGGTDGLRFIRLLLRQAEQYPSLRSITLELDPRQVDSTRRLLRQWAPNAKITTVSDGRRVRGLIARR